MKCLFVCHFEPTPVGHGGNHRAYQIAHDLSRAFGPENLTVLSHAAWRARQRPPIPRAPASSYGRLAARIRRSFKLEQVHERLKRLVPQDPVWLLAGKGPSITRYAQAGLLDEYVRQATTLHEPAVCVIEHPSFASLYDTNERLGIPTIACPQNIESLDAVAPLAETDRAAAYRAGIDLIDEYRAYARCDARLFMTSADAHLFNGLGLPSDLYGYRPVGEVRRMVDRIRAERASAQVDSTHFLLLGSAAHRTTRSAMAWLVRQVASHGLPDGVRIVAAGKNTESLVKEGDIPGLEVRGFVSQDELESLLINAAGVLIPQQSGYGGLTRLPELVCADVPVIVSRHPAEGYEGLPGLTIVDDSWDAWYAAMQAVMRDRPSTSEVGYAEWERTHPNPFGATVEKVLARRSNKV